MPIHQVMRFKVVCIDSSTTSRSLITEIDWPAALSYEPSASLPLLSWHSCQHNIVISTGDYDSREHKLSLAPYISLPYFALTHETSIEALEESYGCFICTVIVSLRVGDLSSRFISPSLWISPYTLNHTPVTSPSRVP